MKFFKSKVKRMFLSFMNFSFHVNKHTKLKKEETHFFFNIVNLSFLVDHYVISFSLCSFDYYPFPNDSLFTYI